MGTYLRPAKCRNHPQMPIFRPQCSSQFALSVRYLVIHAYSYWDFGVKEHYVMDMSRFEGGAQMKVQLFLVCALLVVVMSFSACYGAKAKTIKTQYQAPMNVQGSKTSVPKAVQPNAGGTMSSGYVNPAGSSSNAMPAPAATGAGPSMPAGLVATMPSTGVAVDSNFVYVLQEGKLYKFAKGDVNSCGTAVPPPCEPSPSGAGPAPCPGTCGMGMSYIPGMTPSNLTVTTRTPCVTPCPTPCPSGAGPAPGEPCPPNTCPPNPCAEVSCGSCKPAPCSVPTCPTSGRGPCGIGGATTPQVTYTTSTTTVPGGPGSGPCSLPTIGTISASAQQALTCLQSLSGAEADRAYLQAVIQLNLSVLAVSDAAAVHLGTTSLQDYATNSIADSRSNAAQAQEWLKDKYCLNVAACLPPLTTGFDICDLDRPGAAFDEAYRNQVIQYYLDEIALSQVEIERGLDCTVKAFAMQTIKNDQVRITRLRRCRICGYS